MQYGYFDDAAREYIITTPKTPVKWVNYIGTLAFGGFVDQTGGALLCKDDPALNRITKYIPQMPASDFKGTTLYLRVREPAAKAYRVFSPFFVPTLDPYDRYECHVGLGYSRIVSEFYGIRTEVTMVGPANTKATSTICLSSATCRPIRRWPRRSTKHTSTLSPAHWVRTLWNSGSQSSLPRGQKRGERMICRRKAGNRPTGWFRPTWPPARWIRR